MCQPDKHVNDHLFAQMERLADESLTPEQIGPHAHARPDQTGAQFAARLVCRKCGKRPEDYRIERSPTYGYTADLSNLLSYRSRRD